MEYKANDGLPTKGIIVPQRTVCFWILFISKPFFKHYTLFAVKQEFRQKKSNVSDGYL